MKIHIPSRRYLTVDLHPSYPLTEGGHSAVWWRLIKKADNLAADRDRVLEKKIVLAPRIALEVINIVHYGPRNVWQLTER